MKNLRFEKVNMKIVVLVGVTIIAILTAMFIIFRTNLIIDRDKDKDPNTTENGNGNGNSGGESGNNGDDPGEDPKDPNGGNGNSGGNGSSGNGNGNGNSGNGNGNGNSGGEPGGEEPNYDDPDEDPVSKEAKERTKDKEDLTVVEKEYIIQENISKELAKEKEIQNDCVDNTFCKVDVTEFNQYKSKKDKIGDCSGDVIFTYNKKEKKLDFDMSEVKCEE